MINLETERTISDFEYVSDAKRFVQALQDKGIASARRDEYDVIVAKSDYDRAFKELGK